jgi:hypothetical protein
MSGRTYLVAAVIALVSAASWSGLQAAPRQNAPRVSAAPASAAPASAAPDSRALLKQYCVSLLAAPPRTDLEDEGQFHSAFQAEIASTHSWSDLA